MASQPAPSASIDFPVSRPLKLTHLFSFVVVLLVAGLSAAGLTAPGTTYPDETLCLAFLPTDVTNLLIGVPMLLLSMWWARRGKLIGLLLWPGALFYALYNYLVYALAMPFGLTYVLYLLMITIGGCLLVDLVASIDQAAVQQRLSGAVPEQLAGGILIGIGVLIFLRTIVMMVSALLSGVHPSRLDVALLTTDLVTSPIWVIGGLALWRRRPFGYGVGAGLLFQGSMLFVGLIVVLLMQPIVGGGPLAVVDILIVFVMGFICFIPFVLFVWGIIRASA